jgi:hypothetical protein
VIQGRHPQLLDGSSLVSWLVPGLGHSMAWVLRVTWCRGTECSLRQSAVWFKGQGSGCYVLGEFFELSHARSS